MRRPVDSLYGVITSNRKEPVPPTLAVVGVRPASLGGNESTLVTQHSYVHLGILPSDLQTKIREALEALPALDESALSPRTQTEMQAARKAHEDQEAKLKKVERLNLFSSVWQENERLRRAYYWSQPTEEIIEQLIKENATISETLPTVCKAEDTPPSSSPPSFLSIG